MSLPEITIDLRSKAILNYNVSAGEEWNDKLTITTADTIPMPISLVGSICTMVIKKGALTVANLTLGSGLTIGGASSNELYFNPPLLSEGYYDIKTRIELANGDDIC